MPVMWRSRDKGTHIRCGEAGIEYTHAMRRSRERMHKRVRKENEDVE